MKLRAAIADYETEVNIRLGSETVRAEVGDRAYELRLQLANESRLLLLFDGEVFDCRVEGELRSGAMVDIVIGANRYPIVLTDPRRLRSAAVAGLDAGGAAQIAAPMPGKIVRVLAQAGDQVEAGAGIVVVEAMKMQNEMKSPKAGKVVSINVDVGATVNGGDVLAVIE